MKKIIFSVLALGLTMGAMAQKTMVSDVDLTGAETMIAQKGKVVATSKAAGAYYPSIFNDCASLDNPIVYGISASGYQFPHAGSGLFMGAAQTYEFTSPVTVTGVEVYMANAWEGDEATPEILLMDADFAEELAVTTYNTSDVPLTPEDAQAYVFGPVTANFSSPVSGLTSFAIGVMFPEYGETSTDIIIPSTEDGCFDGNYARVNYQGEWLEYADLIGEPWDINLFIFPILDGNVGLTDVELNSLSYVYPNPAKNEVMLASSFSINKVEVVNVLGQVVFASDVNANSIKVNTSSFAAGSYVVKMYTESGVATKKLVVE